MKLGGYMVMITTLIAILTLVGIDTGVNSVLEYVGININADTSTINSVDAESSSFWDSIFEATGVLLLLGVAGGAILIGLFGKGYDVSLVIAPFIIAIGGAFVLSFTKVFLLVNGFGIWWMTAITGIIFGGLMVGFIMSCLDYFAGR